MKRPNVIYILTDDQRADLLGCAGHPFLKTPNIDALAAEGTRFTNARCTSPLCTPSRACHYTGQWERRHGVNFNSETALSPEAWESGLLGQLKKAGYWTAWVGKNHVPVGEGGYGSGYLESWFDCWWGNHGHSSFYPKEIVGGKGRLYSNASQDTQAEVFAEGALNVLRPDPDFVSRAVTPFPERPADRPFCLCVTFNLPHGAACSTMQLRPEDDELYKSGYRGHYRDVELPATWRSWKESYAKLPRELYNGLWIPDYDYVKTPQDLQERVIRQCQVVTAVDRFVGQLRGALEETGEADNTIIVFSTDHGLFFGEHGLGGKTLLYEEALRIPMIVYDPREEAARGQVSDELVAVPDLAPTVLDLCGIEVPDTMDGTSLKPLLHGGTQTVRDALFVENLFDWQNYPRCEGVIERGWKYLRYFRRSEDPEQEGLRLRSTLDDYARTRLSMSGGGEEPVYEELYDLAADPGETTNLAGEAVHAATLRRLRVRCRDLAAASMGGREDTDTVAAKR